MASITQIDAQAVETPLAQQKSKNLQEHPQV